ncbi:MAG: D-alanine--D-alanine ligase family protein [Nocardioidaceae bacterium]
MSAPTRKPCVAVIFGGRSSEHAISCVTAGSVLRVIDRDRYDVIPVGITTTGRWVLERDDPGRLAISDPEHLPEVDESAPALALVNQGAETVLVGEATTGKPQSFGPVDVVFPLLHGPWGEDGTIQGLLEMAGVRYVGAGVLASAIGMDKHYMKLVLRASGLPVLPYTAFTRTEWAADESACAESVGSLRYPVFVKPCRGGSSIGISKVGGPGELAAAVELAFRYDPKVIVEASAGGSVREVECAVLEGFGDNPAHASVAAEISVDPAHDFYDFEAKYLGSDTTITVPAVLPDQVAETVQRLSVRAFDAISCEGLARVDFFVIDEDRVVVNEINTMPGFTPSSMFPVMWANSGIDYPHLVDRLIQLALHRDLGLR